MAGVPAFVAVSLMLVWAVDDGGFDTSTWSWGALVLLATFAFLLVVGRRAGLRISRPSAIALGCLSLYVAWSYLSMTWARYPGLALEGSNRALLYLLIFALMTVLPWTRTTACAALLTFAIGVGVIAIVLLIRLASDDNVAVLFVGGRLAAPTGYINSTAALFTMQAVVSIALATRRDLPGPVRGLLLALAGAALQLAIIVESRGWLFTLPLVAALAIVIVPDRLRACGAAVIPVVAALIPLRSLLRVYEGGPSGSLGAAAVHAAQPALMVCAGAFVLGTLLAWADILHRRPRMTPARRRTVGALLAVVAAATMFAGGLVVSKGQPLQFISRQWHGFSHEQKTWSGSHFTDVGSGRYDFWRVAVDAFLAHPIGGLGQDNFGEYYLVHGHTAEEPSWTHSLELRLLAHTGIVGFVLFCGFVVAAILAALKARRTGDASTRMLAGTMLLPLVVWLVHGSLDWFWEIPALSGPALGFLGAAGGLPVGVAARVSAPRAEPSTSTATGVERKRGAAGHGGRRIPGPLLACAAVLALLSATAVLAFPFLSAHEVAKATDIQTIDPQAALRDLTLAAELNPLSSDPGRVAGAIDLRSAAYAEAQRRFRQSIAAEPDGWFSWLGAGLAASALGERSRAHRDFVIAYSIDRRQPAVSQALQRVYSRSPLTATDAFKLLVLIQ